MPVEDEIRELRSVVENALGDPVLTREVNGEWAPDGGGTPASSGSGSSLTSTARNAIRDLLGWRYRSNDAKGFVAALNKAVTLKDVEGHTEWTWNVRPLMVQADLGEVTGAQASVHARAKAALEQILPLLENLAPARPDPIQEQIDSIREIVRVAWTEIVNELGVISGPRIERVDRYLIQLLGSADPDDLDRNGVFQRPEQVDGSLGTLRDRFGLDRGEVLTVRSEQNFTNFLIIVDHTTSFLRTWDAQKASFARSGGSDPFLGTQLVRLSEELAVMVESVHEIAAAMDSVFFGPDERQVTVIEFPNLDEVEPLTIGELLAWIEQFATVEARHLIENCGRDGVNIVTDQLEVFENMLNNLP